MLRSALESAKRSAAAAEEANSALLHGKGAAESLASTLHVGIPGQGG